MRLAVEVFGKSVALELSRGVFGLTVGALLDLYVHDNGTRGLRWFDWLSHGNGNWEAWVGRRHIDLTWGPTWERWRGAEAAGEALA